MPHVRSTDVRIRVGSWNLLTDVPAATYGIENLAVNGDQYGGNSGGSGLSTTKVLVPWAAPVLLPYGEYARVSVFADFSASPEGFYKFDWLFSFWTFDMMSLQCHGVWFPAGVYSNTFSVAMPNDTGLTLDWFHATGYRPVRNDQFRDFDPVPGGYANVKLRFDAATKYTPS